MAALAAGAASDAGSAAPCALIEIGPPQSLLTPAAATWGGQALWLPSLTSTRDEFRQMLDSAARLYEAGHDLHWPALAEGRAASRVSAPTYAFERERYWPDRPAKVTSPAVPDLAVGHQRPPPSTRPAAIATDRPPNDARFASASCSSTARKQRRNRTTTASCSRPRVSQTQKGFRASGFRSGISRSSAASIPIRPHCMRPLRGKPRASASWPAASSCRCTTRFG